MAEPIPFSYAQELLEKDPALKKTVEDLRRRRDQPPTPVPGPPSPGVSPLPVPTPSLVQAPTDVVSLEQAPKLAAQRQQVQEKRLEKGQPPLGIGVPETDFEEKSDGIVDKIMGGLRFYQKQINDPFIGSVQFNFAKLIPGDQFYERRVPELMAGGMGAHEALGQARREYADQFQPKALTILQNVTVDPTHMLPIIGFAKMPAAIGRSIPRMASVLASEAGGIRLAGEATGAISKPVWRVEAGEGVFKVVSEEGKVVGQYRTSAEAAKAAERATRQTDDLLESIGSVPVPPEAKLRQQMRLGKERRAELNAAQTEERGRRVAEATEALNTGQGEAAWTKTLALLKGPLTDIRLQPLEELMSVGDLNTLREQIRVFSTPKFFDRINARAALDDLWLGKIPPPSQLKELEKIFPDISAVPQSADPLRFGTLALEILNVPRTLKTSFDMSAPLRQGVFFLPGHPNEWANSFGRMIQSFGSENFARAAEEAISTAPYRQLADDSGLSITSRFGGLAGREEAYMSRLLQRIPVLGEFVKASERAYGTFLNKLRMDVFHTLSDQLLRQGKTLAQNPEDFKELALYINRATGRGGLGPLEGAAPILNTLLFSPRNLAGQITLPLSLAKSTPMVRKMVARDMVAFFGTGMLILGLLELNGVDVIKDPRSADFAKVRVGPTRLDIWGGKQPLARFLGRFATKKAVSTSSGEAYDMGRDEVLWQFVRSKFSPTTGIATDVLREETFLGEKLDVSTGTAGQIARSGLLPLIVDDLWEAFDEAGIGGVVTASPSFFGVGAVSFTTMRDLQNRTAEELYDKPYLQLDTLDQKPAVNANPEVQAKLLEIQENQEALDARSLFNDRMTRFQTVRSEHEVTLTKSLNAPGKAKRLHIADYKSKVYVVGQTLLEDPRLAPNFDAREAEQPTRDYVRGLYWSAPLPWDPNAEQPDYDALDAAREDALGLADILGVDRAYVLRRNPNRFNDPRVEFMVAEYETDQHLLRRYWNLDDRAMDMLGLNARQRSRWREERNAPLLQQSVATRAVKKLFGALKEHMFATDAEVRELLLKWQYRQGSFPSPFGTLPPLTPDR